MRELRKFKGCLLGGAAGDALGYAVEFKSLDEIRKKYGENGITRYELKDGKALISDGTQMTMFTANGILFGATRERVKGVMAPVCHYIHKAYKDWLRTQMPSLFKDEDIISWIYHLRTLQSKRAPGNTCLYALSSGVMGTLESRLNSSKGCGGMMRVAPIGLYFDKEEYGTERIDLIGAKSAAITHGHPLGFVSAAAMVHIINNAAHTDENLYNIVYDCLDTLDGTKETYPETQELIDLIERAVKLAGREIDDTDAIRRLGGSGLLAEEALAIGVYCSLKYQNSFEKAIVAAVNHSGDSNSTGLITGSIMGAYLGIDAVPDYYLENLELRSELEELATDLFTGCPDDIDFNEGWNRKYIKCDTRIH
ncbi:MAG: ADP-ribosylglycohydrolase family protein [Clostridia bacterium]|nr:ADP-ribosylglycohydrolase family protein [Clostridia bacterium]